jgi:hypothetical protein
VEAAVPPLDAGEHICKMMGLSNRNVVFALLAALLVITVPIAAQECTAVRSKHQFSFLLYFIPHLFFF